MRTLFAAVRGALADGWARLPLPWRKAITDFATPFVSGVMLILPAMILAGPSPELTVWAWIGNLVTAVLNVAVNAARRSWQTNRGAVVGTLLECTGTLLSPAELDRIAELVAAQVAKRISELGSKT